MMPSNNSQLVLTEGNDPFNMSSNVTLMTSLDYADYDIGQVYVDNPGPPMWRPPPPDGVTNALQTAIYFLKIYYTPLLVIVGILGNIFSCVVMLRTKLKMLSFVQYFAAILAADTLFLINLMCLWMVDMGVNLYRLGAWCHFTTFLSHSSGFLSLWYTVCLAVDRLIFAHFALLERKMCTPLRAKILITSLALTAIAVFLNMSLTVGLVQVRQTLMCTPLRQFVTALRKLNHVDIFINSIIPYCVLIIIFSLGAIKAYGEHRWMRIQGRTRNTTTFKCEHERGQVRASLSFMLYYLLLTLPVQTFRVTLTLKDIVSPITMPPDMKLMLWQHILQYLYYTHFSFNLFILLATYHGFRMSIKVMFVSVFKSVQSALACKTDNDNDLDIEGDAIDGLVDEASVALCVIKESE